MHRTTFTHPRRLLTVSIAAGLIVATVSAWAGNARAEPKPLFAYGAAFVSQIQVTDEWGIAISAVRHFSIPGNNPLDEAHASVVVYACNPNENGCTFNAGYSCEPTGSPLGESRLADADDFTIDFYSLHTAALDATFVCHDPDATQLAVSIKWAGSGRLFLGPAPPSERFREIVVSSGTVTGLGAETFSFEQRTELQSMLTSRFFRDP